MMDWSMWTPCSRQNRSIFCSTTYWLADLSFRRAQRSPELPAEFAGAADSSDAQQFDARRQILRPRRFLAQQSGAQIFLVVVAEDGYDTGFRSQFFLSFDGCNKIAAGRDAHRESQGERQFLRHQDSIAIGYGEDVVEFLKTHNLGNEFVGDSLNSVMAHLASGGKRWRFRRFDRMDANRGIALSQKLSYAHYSATGANARDKR